MLSRLAPLLTIIVCFAAPLFSSAAAERSTQGVAIDGVVIHPAWIQTMSADLADPLPVVTAIDLDGAARSNRFTEAVETDGQWIRAREGSNVFECRRIAVSNGGTHAFELRLSSEGTGVFRSLLLVRVVVDEVNESGGPRKRRMLVCRGSCSIGDRDPGNLIRKGDTIVIEKSPSRSADLVIELDS